MQHSSKKRTWANDDEIAETLTPVNANGQSVDPNQPVEDVAQTQRKKTKVETAAPSIQKVPTQERMQHVAVTEPVPSSTANEEADEKDDKEEAMGDEPKSDADWLRSKTSRLLGLLDDEEQAEHDTAAPSSRFKPVEDDDDDDNDPHSGGVALDNVASRPTTDEETKHEETDANIELIRNSARLFIRNLPYDATETDLDPIFSPFGKIEEVSNFLLVFPEIGPILLSMRKDRTLS
jgi:multiple RNA-binding domain-containing protein 1